MGLLLLLSASALGMLTPPAQDAPALHPDAADAPLLEGWMISLQGYEGTNFTTIKEIEHLPDGRTWVAGYMVGTVTFGNQTLTSGWADEPTPTNMPGNVFLGLLDTGGEWLWAGNVEGVHAQLVQDGLVADADGASVLVSLMGSTAAWTQNGTSINTSSVATADDEPDGEHLVLHVSDEGVAEWSIRVAGPDPHGRLPDVHGMVPAFDGHARIVMTYWSHWNHTVIPHTQGHGGDWWDAPGTGELIIDAGLLSAEGRWVAGAEGDEARAMMNGTCEPHALDDGRGNGPSGGDGCLNAWAGGEPLYVEEIMDISPTENGGVLVVGDSHQFDLMVNGEVWNHTTDPGFVMLLDPYTSGWSLVDIITPAENCTPWRPTSIEGAPGGSILMTGALYEAGCVGDVATAPPSSGYPWFAARWDAQNESWGQVHNANTSLFGDRGLIGMPDGSYVLATMHLPHDTFIHRIEVRHIDGQGATTGVLRTHGDSKVVNPYLVLSGGALFLAGQSCQMEPCGNLTMGDVSLAPSARLTPFLVKVSDGLWNGTVPDPVGQPIPLDPLTLESLAVGLEPGTLEASGRILVNGTSNVATWVNATARHEDFGLMGGYSGQGQVAAASTTWSLDLSTMYGNPTTQEPGAVAAGVWTLNLSLTDVLGRTLENSSTFVLTEDDVCLLQPATCAGNGTNGTGNGTPMWPTVNVLMDGVEMGQYGEEVAADDIVIIEVLVTNHSTCSVDVGPGLASSPCSRLIRFSPDAATPDHSGGMAYTEVRGVPGTTSWTFSVDVVGLTGSAQTIPFEVFWDAASGNGTTGNGTEGNGTDANGSGGNQTSSNGTDDELQPTPPTIVSIETWWDEADGHWIEIIASEPVTGQLELNCSTTGSLSEHDLEAPALITWTVSLGPCEPGTSSVLITIQDAEGHRTNGFATLGRSNSQCLQDASDPVPCAVGDTGGDDGIDAAAGVASGDEGWLTPEAEQIVTTTMAVGSLGALVALGVAFARTDVAAFAGSKWLLSAFALLGITREFPQGERTRGRILGYLTANQGTHLRELRRQLSLSSQQATHHLSVLEDEGEVWHLREAGKVRWFTSGISAATPADELPRPDHDEVVAGPKARLLEVIASIEANGEVADQGTLGDLAGMSRQLAAHHLKGLIGSGHVASERSGVRRVYTLTELGREHLMAETDALEPLAQFA